MSRRAAANGANVAYSTLKDWLAEGRAPGARPLYADFVARVEAAESTAETAMVDALFLAAKKGSYQAAQFWLSSRRAADWALKASADAEAEAATEQTASDLDVARAVVSALESTRKAG